jgi:segregation and condensation protein A
VAAPPERQKELTVIRSTREVAEFAAADPRRAEPARSSLWNLDQLPPELEYFRTSDAYRVELADFQGPLDLLLYLIQKDEIDIYDIPIAHITQQFLRHIEDIQRLSLERAGEFIAMAATLLVIKMKMLMPQHASDEEEEEDAEDPRAELVRRLLEYKRFKEAAAELQRCAENRRRYFVRSARYPFTEKLDLEPQLRIEMYDLLVALGTVFDRLQSPPVHAVRRERFTVIEKVDLIRRLIGEQTTVRFEELFAGDAIRMEVVVTFIAMLELVKQGEVVFLQTEPRGPIWVQANPAATAAAAADYAAALEADA